MGSWVIIVKKEIMDMIWIMRMDKAYFQGIPSGLFSWSPWFCAVIMFRRKTIGGCCIQMKSSRPWKVSAWGELELLKTFKTKFNIVNSLEFSKILYMYLFEVLDAFNGVGVGGLDTARYMYMYYVEP